MSIWLFDGDTYRLQADNVYWGQFDARGGWMAFTRLGNLGQELVWLRSPNGDERQITFFSASSKVEAVSPTGEVFYIYNRRRYLSSPAGELVEIGSDQGEVLWLDGEWTLSLGRSLFALDPQTVAVEADTPALSADATVGSVFPNPTSARATITFSLPSAGFVRLSVLDPIGRRVATLAEGDYAVGNHTVEWESARASSGVYTISLETSTGTVSKRLTVVR